MHNLAYSSEMVIESGGCDAPGMKTFVAPWIDFSNDYYMKRYFMRLKEGRDAVLCPGTVSESLLSRDEVVHIALRDTGMRGVKFCERMPLLINGPLVFVHKDSTVNEVIIGHRVMSDESNMGGDAATFCSFAVVGFVDTSPNAAAMLTSGFPDEVYHQKRMESIDGAIDQLTQNYRLLYMPSINFADYGAENKKFPSFAHLIGGIAGINPSHSRIVYCSTQVIDAVRNDVMGGRFKDLGDIGICHRYSIDFEALL